MASGESTTSLKRHLSEMSESGQPESGRAQPHPYEPLTPAPSSPPRAPSTDLHLSGSSTPERERTGTARDTYLEFLQKAHPELTPRNDFEVLLLGSNWLKEMKSAEEKQAWLAQQWQEHVDSEEFGSAEAAMESVKAILDAVLPLAGRKPRPGDEGVLQFSIPDSDYSIRLWPGPLEHAIYCLAFVDNATQRYINVPTDHTFWHLPIPSAPWIPGAGPVELVSAERSMGIQPEDIIEGEEKYFLRDGMTCALTRPGKENALFTVPLRQQPRGLYDSAQVMTPVRLD
ncbi:hypothetical protein BN946_scf184938.g3 [Trametes cinnabarina]|uniref:Uncharacterized protein n=1 Tax=Pycnoporus cinnabarinus TaxID=5643 RepID=A0A060S1T9_PYCCI|nr:hypothetical protein BN946_scf184938.g3 [Trametes cinnabarina]